MVWKTIKQTNRAILAVFLFIAVIHTREWILSFLQNLLFLKGLKVKLLKRYFFASFFRQQSLETRF